MAKRPVVWFEVTGEMVLSFRAFTGSSSIGTFRTQAVVPAMGLFARMAMASEVA
jgi:hypothetical protein